MWRVLLGSIALGFPGTLSQSRLLQIGALLLTVGLVLIILTWAGQHGVSYNTRLLFGVIALAGMVVLLQRFSGSQIIFGYLAVGITALAAIGITVEVIHKLATANYD